MKIFSIVLYPLPTGEPIAASLNNGIFRIDPHEKMIRKEMRALADLVIDQQGIHKLKTPEGIYYAVISSDKLAIWAVDQELSTHAQLALFEKIRKASASQQLATLLKNPEEAIKSPTDVLHEQIDEIKSIVLKDIDKLIERGDDLETLLAKTEMLATQTVRFKQKAKELRQQYQCPFFFSIFKAIKNLFTKDDGYEYEYKPTRKQF